MGLEKGISQLGAPSHDSSGSEGVEIADILEVTQLASKVIDDGEDLAGQTGFPRAQNQSQN